MKSQALQQSYSSADRTDALKMIATMGYAAKGVVYLIVGGLAVRAAVDGSQSDVEGSRGALATIVQQSYGQVLLAIVALGLAAYVVWRSAQALIDPESKGDDASGVAVRVYYGVSALAYTSLLVYAVSILFSTGSDGGDGSSSLLRGLGEPWQSAAYSVVALGFAAGAIYGLWRAYEASFRSQLDLSELNQSARDWVVRSGRFGLAARSVVFLVLMWSFASAAMSGGSPNETGTESALLTIENLGGTWGLLLIALGLAAYGMHQLVKSRYRKIEA